METIIIISITIGIIILVCFFGISSDVSNIKKATYKDKESSAILFKLYISLGEKEKAKEMLYNMIEIFCEEEKKNIKKKYKGNAEDIVNKTFAKELAEVGLTINNM